MRSRATLPRLGLGILLVAAACGRESTVPDAGADVELAADQIAYGVEHVMTKSGVREAILRGDTAYFRESGREVDLLGVSLEFFDPSGTQSGQLTARSGEYEPSSSAMTARGNVVLIVRTDNGERRIETEELHYDLRQNRIWSDQPTVSREGGVVYRGDSFTSDTQFRNLRVQGASTSGGVPTGNAGITF